MFMMDVFLNMINIGLVLVLVFFTLYLAWEVKSIREDLLNQQKKLLLLEIEILNLKEANYQLEGDILDLKSNQNFINRKSETPRQKTSILVKLNFVNLKNAGFHLTNKEYDSSYSHISIRSIKLCRLSNR